VPQGVEVQVLSHPPRRTKLSACDDEINSLLNYFVSSALSCSSFSQTLSSKFGDPIIMDLSKLPSPFYRVSLKLIILNDQNKLLVGKASDGTWELPGGGFEHNESLRECLSRELEEELGVKLGTLGEVVCIYRGVNSRGYWALKIALNATLESYDFKFGELTDAEFKTKEELLKLKMNSDEKGIKDFVNQIWPHSNLE
jgi:ADP-ribose pyrophosphatase YjhB (NUDIX family)